tara:strand:+ start:641 stop:1129 length:489 start_codon:yes stop_codon:yes gene_type:complete
MKKLFAIIGIFIFLSCTVDDENVPKTENIIGTWEKTYEINAEDFPDLEEESYEYVLQYKFSEKNKFESYSFLRNIPNDSIVGYNSRDIGNYSTEEDVMKLLYNKYNSNQETLEFQDLDELILFKENVEWNFDFSINNDELVFDFDPCGPAELCLADLKFKRV